MATSQINGVIQHLRSILRDGVGLTDGQLLEDYISHRDEAAFAALVRRHGPMVWGVCHRVLRNYHAAEDAFQATFLVLVRRVAAISSRELLANWLYGVAHQTALKARATAAKRKERERQVQKMPEAAVTQQDQWRDLQPVLDEELSRLPDKYRGVIVLCDLEGMTRKEAAGQLGCAEGTVASRLARARIMLAKRLKKRGVALSGGALAAVLVQQAASAGVPNSVVVSTIKAASLFATGKAAATGAISVKVAALTEGVMKAMLMSKLKAVVAVVLVLGFIATGATILTCRTAAAQGDKKPTSEKSVDAAAKQEKDRDKETFTAWGKEIGGLQAGLGYRPGQKRAYSHGETVTLVVRVRNVGKEEVKFQYLKEFFRETPPAVKGGKGKPVIIPAALDTAIFHTPVNVSLAPGKEIELYELKLQLRPASETGNRSDLTLYGTGKLQIQYEKVLGNSSAASIKLDSTLSKLATANLELEVKSDPPPADKKPKQKLEEGLTAWGKEVGGLQAGLGYLPGQKRAYSHGETVKLVVRVRNVGKDRVQLQYLKTFFVEEPPIVTDAGGMPLSLSSFPIPKEKRKLEELGLAPGRDVEIDTMQFQLRLEGFVDEFDPIGLDPTIRGTGKFRVRYERLAPKDIDNIGAKLATGELELEIKSDKK